MDFSRKKKSISIISWRINTLKITKEEAKAEIITTDWSMR
jgi:hypothetical protein